MPAHDNASIQLYQASLTTREQRDFARAERTIARGLKSFLEVGLALKEIRDKRLYRQRYNYVRVSAEASPAGMAVDPEYDLPLRHSMEGMPVNYRQFRLAWREEEVVECDPAAPVYPARSSTPVRI